MDRFECRPPSPQALPHGEHVCPEAAVTASCHMWTHVNVDACRLCKRDCADSRNSATHWYGLDAGVSVKVSARHEACLQKWQAAAAAHRPVAAAR